MLTGRFGKHVREANHIITGAAAFVVTFEEDEKRMKAMKAVFLYTCSSVFNISTKFIVRGTIPFLCLNKTLPSPRLPLKINKLKGKKNPNDVFPTRSHIWSLTHYKHG